MLQFKVKRESVTMRVALLSPIHMKVESAVKVGSTGQIYDGSYEVTPTVKGLTMETKDKYMLNDVDIQPIPIFKVGNNSGGKTIYIANEV